MKNPEKIREILDYYKKQKNAAEQENLVNLLWEIQETEGCISREVQALAAESLEIKPGVLSCLIRLYPSLKEEAYVHELIVCTGKRCRNKNSKELLAFIKKELDIQEGGLSRDKRIRLVTRNCLKKCATSPNLLLDQKHYPGMNKEKLKELLRGL